MSKSEKIINLTSNKTKQFSLTLNDELISLFKQACEKAIQNQQNYLKFG